MRERAEADTEDGDRRKGVTSIRSCEPVCISSWRFAPVVDVPNSADITMIPGTNHWSDEPGSRSLTWLSIEWLVSIVAMIAVVVDIEVREPPELIARIGELTRRLGRAT